MRHTQVCFFLKAKFIKNLLMVKKINYVKLKKIYLKVVIKYNE
jgi:hypothetical protein